MGLAARALENAGIPTVIASWSPGFTAITAPGRIVYTPYTRGSTLGDPGDAVGQLTVIRAALALLAQPAPQEAVKLKRADPT